MTFLAKDIILRATDVLQDATSTRWDAAELVRWLNDGQREVAIHRPDAFTTPAAPITLVAGSHQSLPATAAKLIDIPNNTAAPKRAIRQAVRSQLDDIDPEWRSMTGAAVVKHFTYDPRAPRQFEVYPPAINGTQVDAIVSAYPIDITVPAAGSTYDDVTGNINAPEIFASVLVDYVLYRAFIKEDEFASIPRANLHFAAFAQALGIEVSAGMTIAPGVSNPGGVSTS